MRLRDVVRASETRPRHVAWTRPQVKGGYKLEVRGSPEGAGGGEVKGCLTAVKAEGCAALLAHRL